VNSSIIAQKYDAVAPAYDRLELVPELLGLRSLRRKLVANATGDVLEVAAGTGKNLEFYSRTCRLTAVDLSRAMLARAQRRADRLGLAVTFDVMDVEHLAFAEDTFDTVVDTMSLCTFPNPVAALRELGRVCRSSGRVLLLEHGRSDRAWLQRFQDRRAGKHAEPLGCQWNREPLSLLEQSGLRILRAERHFFGVFHLIQVAKSQ
jgi:ubiquinone/menaquinone biosynthesis C-methylase UbiE